MAVNMFIQFQNPDVPGSSSATGHGGEIEVLPWNHDFAQPTSPAQPPVRIASTSHPEAEQLNS